MWVGEGSEGDLILITSTLKLLDEFYGLKHPLASASISSVCVLLMFCVTPAFNTMHPVEHFGWGMKGQTRTDSTRQGEDPKEKWDPGFPLK